MQRSNSSVWRYFGALWCCLRAALVAGALLLVGCGGAVQPSDIAVAEEFCSKRGGFSSIARFERGSQLIISCQDGTLIEARFGKKT